MQRGCIFEDPLPMPFTNEGCLRQRKKRRILLFWSKPFGVQTNKILRIALGGSGVLFCRGIFDLPVNP